MRSTTTLLSLLSFVAIVAFGLEVTFPTSSDYWVACGFNVLRWTSDGAKDPSIFSVALQSQNKTIINDDQLVANSLNTKQGAAEIFVPCIQATDDVTIHLVNASHYDHKKGLLYSSPTISIKANGTDPAPNSGQKKISSKPDPAFSAASTNISLSAPQTSNTVASSSSNPLTPSSSSPPPSSNANTNTNTGTMSSKNVTSANPGEKINTTATTGKKDNAALPSNRVSPLEMSFGLVLLIAGVWTVL